ncbi:MAG: tRNA lysidine(34) synthetase TilS [Pyrinomonadaceae bacterium]|nr:tRNA lysidine(34) synthetase TilS [Pyrinomonadaceae bacterium]
MNNFVKNLITEWRNLDLPFEDATFVAGVSGGADSVSLALALAELKRLGKLKLRFVIGHADHGLRGTESEKDAEFVRDFAAAHGFELAVEKLEIDKASGNLEQAARTARYDFLSNLAVRVGAKGVLTAHTLNDQAETFLMNLIRGSGLDGLAGMRAFRVFDKLGINTDRETLIIRPLLTWASRDLTEQFCRESAVDFRYDSMNEDLAFQRVRIRKVLIPLLKDFNPKIIERLANTSFVLQEELDQIESMFDREVPIAEFLIDDALKLKNFRELPSAVRRKLVRKWLSCARGSLRGISTLHIEAVDNLAISRKSGKISELPGGDRVMRQGGLLVYSRKKS